MEFYDLLNCMKQGVSQLLSGKNPKNCLSKLFLRAPWAEKVTLSPEFPKGKSCDTSQNFPRGQAKFLAWSECLIQKKSPGPA